MRPDRIVFRVARECLGHARGFGGVAQRLFSAVATRAFGDTGGRLRRAAAASGASIRISLCGICVMTVTFRLPSDRVVNDFERRSRSGRRRTCRSSWRAPASHASDRLALEQAEQLILGQRCRPVRGAASATLLASVSKSGAQCPPGLPMIS